MKKRIAILSLIAIFVAATSLSAQAPAVKAEKAKTETKCDKKDTEKCCKDKKAGDKCCKDAKAADKKCDKACDKKAEVKKAADKK